MPLNKETESENFLTARLPYQGPTISTELVEEVMD